MIVGTSGIRLRPGSKSKTVATAGNTAIHPLSLDFPLMFMGTNFAYNKTHPIVRGLAKLYHPLARYRIEHLNAHFPIETKVVRGLGFFGRQD